MGFVAAPVVISNSNQQRELSCEKTLKSFDAQTATTREQIGYSDCVQLLYPKEIAHQETNEGVFLLFVFIIFFTAIAAICRKIQKVTS
jgi:hypothetical protein